MKLTETPIAAAACSMRSAMAADGNIAAGTWGALRRGFGGLPLGRPVGM
jgi:hypothetical protein